MGVYGNYYLKRAIVAQVGLGANLPEDAIYPLNLGDESGKPSVAGCRSSTTRTAPLTFISRTRASGAENYWWYADAFGKGS
jgi:hypothetical protein